MIAGIFDRLFKRKKSEYDEDDHSQLGYPVEGEDISAYEGQGYDVPRLDRIPSELEMDSGVNYKFEGPEYKLKLHNKSIDMLGDITVHLRAEKKPVAKMLKQKHVVEMLEPGKSLNLKFKLKPQYTIGRSGIYGKVEYFDFKSKERKTVRLPQAYVDFELKELKSKRIDEDKWRHICSGLNNYGVETEVMESAPEKVFNIFKNALNNLGLYMLVPIENVNLYRGIARFYAIDEEENHYAVETQVIGDKQKSKVLFRIWSNEAQGAMALAFKSLDIIDGLLKIKKFIVEI